MERIEWVFDKLRANDGTEGEPDVEDTGVAREDLRAGAVRGAVGNVGGRGALKSRPPAEEALDEGGDDEELVTVRGEGCMWC